MNPLFCSGLVNKAVRILKILTAEPSSVYLTSVVSSGCEMEESEVIIYKKVP